MIREEEPVELIRSQLGVDLYPDKEMDRLDFVHHWWHDVLLHYQDTIENDLVLYSKCSN